MCTLGLVVDVLGIREFRTQAAHAVRRAGDGDRIVITVAGRPVAQLGPLDPGSGAVTLDDLAVRGLILRARRADRPGQPDLHIALTSGTRLDKLVGEVRGR